MKTSPNEWQGWMQSQNYETNPRDPLFATKGFQNEPEEGLQTRAEAAV